jgi:iron complex transport system ATP-binding protein
MDRTAAAELRVERVLWSAGGREVLRGVSLGAGRGEVVGLLGRNGAGKSSLLRCIARLARPAAGRVLLDGGDVWRMTPREAARRIAVVFQGAAGELALGVREVVELGRLPHGGTWSRAAAADRVAVDRALRLLDLEALAGRRVDRLSGGERQRVMVARALAQEPRLLVLDEPTNHLDVRHQLAILALIRRLGCTVLAALHDLNLAAAFCDRLVLLEDGAVAAVGTPEEVLTPSLIQRAFVVAATVDRHPFHGRPRVSYVAHPPPDLDPPDLEAAS